MPGRKTKPGGGVGCCFSGDGEEVMVDQTSDESEQVILIPAAVYGGLALC